MKLEYLKEIVAKIKAGARADDFETEHLEIKPWPGKQTGVAGQFRLDQDKIQGWLREYAVCFANAKGGELLFGLRDDIRGSEAVHGCQGYVVDSLKRIVFEGTRPPITVDFEEHTLPEGTFLVMTVPRSPAIHATTSGRRLRRVGKDCQVVYPDQDIVLEVDKGGDYTAKPLRSVGMEAIDSLEVERLKGWLRHYRAESAEELSRQDATQLLGSLGVLTGEKEKERPTIAALLLVGKSEALREHLPQAEVLLMRFTEIGEPAAEPVSLRCGLLQAIDRAWEIIGTQNRVTTIRDGLFEISVPSFPEYVVREALLNAVVHRSYVENESVNIRIYPERLEIGSPGGFVGGVTSSNILTHEPVRRNRLLAEAFQQLGVVNRAGIGVDRIYRALLSVGKPPPVYQADAHAVTVILPGGTFDERIARLVGRMGQEGHRWKLEELIVLHHLSIHDKATAEELASLFQRPPNDAARILAPLEGELLEQFGKGRGSYYRLRRKFYDAVGAKARYTRGRGIEEPRMLELILNHVREYTKVGNDEVQKICGVDRSGALRLLRKLTKDGRLKLQGRGRGAKYVTA